MGSVASPPSIGNTIYCCVAKGARILHSYNGGDRELEALAAQCIESAPTLHAWFCHTVKERTFGFLMEDGYTYFAIVDAASSGDSEHRRFVDPGAGNLEARRFLEHLRDGSRKAAKNGVEDELVPIICRLIASLESMSRQQAAAAAIAAAESNDASTRSSKSAARAPLLGKPSSKREKRKSRDKVTGACDSGGDHVDRGIKIDVAHDPAGSPAAVALRKSSSLRARAQQQPGRKIWRRLVSVVVAVDVFLCLVLFGVWLLVCRGFQCVS